MLISHFESLPGSIPFAILWHTGQILDKNVDMNKNYSYRYIKVFDPNVCISGIFCNFRFLP